MIITVSLYVSLEGQKLNPPLIRELLETHLSSKFEGEIPFNSFFAVLELPKEVGELEKVKILSKGDALARLTNRSK